MTRLNRPTRMIETADYTVQIHSTGKKRGVASSAAAGLPPLTVATPPEFHGHAGIWSPEHLLVAAVATCFMTTFEAIADVSQLEVADLRVPARGTIERGEDRRYRFTKIVLKPHIEVTDPAHVERAMRIARKAEEACLVTRSLSTEVAVEPAIDVAHALSAV